MLCPNMNLQTPSLFYTMLSKLQTNTNFHNSRSYWIFDEVNPKAKITINFSQSCRRSQSSKPTTNTECHVKAMKSRIEPHSVRSRRKQIPSKPWNQQFERRYIIPRVTYVEKPNRMPLNLSVNWLVYWGSCYLSEKSDKNQVVLT